jgi:preprotein translocase subunit SecG
VGDVERPMQLKRWALMVMMTMMMAMVIIGGLLLQGMEMPGIAYYPGKAQENAESRQQKQEPT